MENITPACHCGNIFLLGHPRTEKRSSVHNADFRSLNPNDSFDLFVNDNMLDTSMSASHQHFYDADYFESLQNWNEQESTFINGQLNGGYGQNGKLELDVCQEHDLIEQESIEKASITQHQSAPILSLEMKSSMNSKKRIHSKKIGKKEYRMILVRFRGVFKSNLPIYKFLPSSIGIVNIKHVCCRTLRDSTYDLICTECMKKLRVVIDGSIGYGQITSISPISPKSEGQKSFDSIDSIEKFLPFQLRKFLFFIKQFPYVHSEEEVPIESFVNSSESLPEFDVVGSFNFSPLNAFSAFA
ncbi:hypothetical protein TRFO_43101 [Tritrichomonas foetus]|uniref:Uncharacterized protein n=1 Tax=Tritrichomonas foetus TaxID=1144522 RepID=A0A1J4KTU7_9EUKA|nr:hypothetical protein TRFO_43101 [Tritrichomonas foetus]|eukprot:OHT14336.1 hypothetical protein TRFO_43101 [Tritrichomonas foetus]